jgi:hypothetical protein
MRRALLVVLLSPFLLGATDPAGDLVQCRTGEPASGEGLDIADATARLTEGGTALEFTVGFHGRPEAPDPEDPAFRVDILLRDPRLPTFSFGPYRGVNRIVRFDATDPPEGTIFLLAERGLSQPSTFALQDGTLRVTVAGRQLGVEDEDLESIDLTPLLWTVIARDGPACDLLGAGRPVRHLEIGSATESPSPSSSPEPATTRPQGTTTPAPGPDSRFPTTTAVGVTLGAALLAWLFIRAVRARAREHRRRLED